MIRLIVLIVLLLPMPVHAESVRVRSGEHADFTRLLVEFGQQEDWVFGRVDGGYEFRSARGDVEFDLRNAFDLIPRTRVQELASQGGGRLYVRVDCDCHADAFDLRRGQVVLDIKDGPAEFVESSFEAVLDPFVPRAHDEDSDPAAGDTTGTGRRSSDTSSIPGTPMERRAGLPLFQSGILGQPIAPVSMDPERTLRDPSGGAAAGTNDVGSRGRVSPDPLPVPQSDVAETADISGETIVSNGHAMRSPGDRVAETESGLLEEVARAAAQGLLEAEVRAAESGVVKPTAASAAQELPSDLPPMRAPPPPVSPAGHLSVETGIDRAFAADLGPMSLTDSGDPCVDPDLIDVAAWGGGAREGEALGAYRASILGEFDIANGKGVTDLVRHYVYMAFGAEAKALIARFPKEVVRPDLLSALADVMDSGFAADPVPLMGQMGCDGPIALWATMAQPELFPAQAINAAAITQSFGALPPHLRRHLGPSLAGKLLDSGDNTTAESIRAAVERIEPDQSVALALIAARIERAAGAVDDASSRLDEAVARADAELAGALLDRVEADLTDGREVPAEVATLVNSVAFEARGTDAGASLWEAEIRALASAKDFAGAFARLDAAELDAVFDSTRISELGSDLFRVLVHDAGDAEFLRLAASRMPQAVTLPSTLRRALTRRFLDLGLISAARKVLGGEGALPQLEDRVLFARIALAQQQPSIAIGYLAGVETEEANRLRANALAAAGDFENALQAYGALGDPKLQRRAAWRGGKWDAFASLDEGAETEVARLMIGIERVTGGAESGAVQEEALIGETQLILDHSRTTRAAISALLAAIESPEVERKD